MSDSENQGTWVSNSTNRELALEATITTLKARLWAAEGKAALADEARRIDVGFRAGVTVGTPPGWQDWCDRYDALSAPTNEEKASDTKGTNDVAN